MTIYRLTTSTYKDDLTGTGARLYGGRWNSPGIPALYTAENISLAVLEILVRADRYTLPQSYVLLKINVPDNAASITIAENKLKKSWENDPALTQWMGDEILKANEVLLLKVPSAVVPEENNYIINTRHKDFKKIKISNSSGFDFDKRLFLKNE